ncbi:MAG: hypothetical protein ACUVQ0_06870, partial [Thermoproteota archaeon]
NEIWNLNLRIAEALVQSATALQSSIERLGTDLARAKEIAKDYIETKNCSLNTRIKSIQPRS